MRTILSVCAMAIAIGSIGHGQAAQAGRNTVFIAPNISRTVTISRSGVVWTTLAIPQGTAISVTFDVAGSALQTNGDGRFVFHGNVEVRALAVSQRDPALMFQQALLQSPIQLTATGVDVEIAPQVP
jgi:hypothetical protein